MKNLLQNFILDSPPSLAFIITLLANLFFFLELDVMVWTGLILTFIVIGLSHGAIDYLADINVTSKGELFKFIALYIFKGIAFATLWYFLPDIAFFSFLLFSVWHFGQTDFNEWKLTQGVLSTLWGTILLLIILISHFQETLSILHQIPHLKVTYLLENITASQLRYLQYGILALGLLFCAIINKKNIWISLAYIVLTISLPLLVSFAIYFIFQHSLHGWKHLKNKLFLSSAEMLWKALPYNLITLIFISLTFIFLEENKIGMLFIILSCVSIPHVINMHHLYKNLEVNKKNA